MWKVHSAILDQVRLIKDVLLVRVLQVFWKVCRVDGLFQRFSKLRSLFAFLIRDFTLFRANVYADQFSSVGLLIHCCNFLLRCAIAFLMLFVIHSVPWDLSLPTVSGANLPTRSIMVIAIYFKTNTPSFLIFLRFWSKRTKMFKTFSSLIILAGWFFPMFFWKFIVMSSSTV